MALTHDEALDRARRCRVWRVQVLHLVDGRPRNLNGHSAALRLIGQGNRHTVIVESPRSGQPQWTVAGEPVSLLAACSVVPDLMAQLIRAVDAAS